MNQFEELIMEESINICEQLSSSIEEGLTCNIGLSQAKDSVVFKTFQSRKSLIVALRAIVLIITALIIYRFLTYDDLQIVNLQPNSQHFTLGDAFYVIVLTLALAFVPTLIGVIIAFFLGLFASRNLVPKQVAKIVKGLAIIIGALPSIMWVVIFAVVAGMGRAAVFVGITFHSISYLIKAYSESYEALDRCVIEALKAIGATWWQIVFRAVIPFSVRNLRSWAFLKFEINFANAIAIVAVGSSGIEFFYLREVGLITYFVLAFAIMLEVGSTKMRRRFS